MSAKVYKAVYTGRRITTAGKVVHRFVRLDSGKELNFRGVKRVAIGFTYECLASSIKVKPKMAQDFPQEINPEWEAEDLIVAAELAANRAAFQASRLSKPHVNAALKALRPLVQGRNLFAREKIVKFLISKLEERVR